MSKSDRHTSRARERRRNDFIKAFQSNSEHAVSSFLFITDELFGRRRRRSVGVSGVRAGFPSGASAEPDSDRYMNAVRNVAFVSERWSGEGK